jgi:anthranilate synthase component 1
MCSNWFILKVLTVLKGDEFNVYRALRSINPSSFILLTMAILKYLGSSPEAQIIVKRP